MSVFSFIKKIESSEAIHVSFNFSPLFDLINGRYFKGIGGVKYLNGGITENNAIVGGSNTQKTGMLVFAIAKFLHRFPMGIVLYNDTESTLDVGRLADAVDELFGIPGYFMENIMNQRFIYKAGNDEFDGTALHNFVKDAYSNYQANRNNPELYVKTVFLNKENKPIEIVAPIMVVNDSLTDMRFNEASSKFTEGDVDEGGKKRTRDMEFGNLKRIVFEDSHHLGGIAGLRMWWVGQVSDIINMDGKPLEKQSTFIRQGKKIAKCPSSILRLPSIGFEIIRGSALKSDNDWMYPNPLGRDVVISADSRENPDLLSYSFSMFRNKGGPSGLQGTFIGSQSDGIQEGLSMYHILKTNNYFGLGIGSKVSHACDLLPDVKIGRTTIRNMIDNNHKLYRAITICYQMWFMQNYWLRLDPIYRITPADLYIAIENLGYDWDILLENTIDYWHLNPEITKVTLSTMELMDIALGLSTADYSWAKKEQRKAA